MDIVDQLIAQGNQHREDNQPDLARACYAQAMVLDPESAFAFNNYGNTLRELGRPDWGVPFLQHAINLDPELSTAHFNLSVCYLLMGDYVRGFPAYESRWNFEHLANTLPSWSPPRWTGQDLQDKTIIVLGEQGHGDIIQFSRYIQILQARGARVYFQATLGLIPLLQQSDSCRGAVITTYEAPEYHFDYWCPAMSIPAGLGVTLDTLNSPLQYLNADPALVVGWRQRLGPKTKMTVGFSWSGRPDSWIHRHKSVPFEIILDMVQKNPQYDWINLQIDATPEQEQQLAQTGCRMFPGTITSWADTAALIQNLDLVISMDTAVSHLSCALGRPTWIMINNYAVDWRWLTDRDSSPWYPSAKLFRQPAMGDWASVTKKISQYLSWFKV